jgi:hypothetical protein
MAAAPSQRVIIVPSGAEDLPQLPPTDQVYSFTDAFFYPGSATTFRAFGPFPTAIRFRQVRIVFHSSGTQTALLAAALCQSPSETEENVASGRNFFPTASIAFGTVRGVQVELVAARYFPLDFYIANARYGSPTWIVVGVVVAVIQSLQMTITATGDVPRFAASGPRARPFAPQPRPAGHRRQFLAPGRRLFQPAT